MVSEEIHELLITNTEGKVANKQSTPCEQGEGEGGGVNNKGG